MIKSNMVQMTKVFSSRRQVLLVKQDEGEDDVMAPIAGDLHPEETTVICFALQLKAALSVCVCVL